MLVALAYLPKHCRGRHAAIVEVELTRRGGTDTELVLLLANGHPWVVFLHHKGSDPAVLLLRGCIGEDNEEPSLLRVRDPALVTLDDPIITVALRAGLECKCIGAGTRLRQAEAANRFCGKPGQVVLLLFFGPVA